jgi:hypothetical protein
MYKNVLAFLVIAISLPAVSQTAVNTRVENTYPSLDSVKIERKSIGAGSPAPMVTVGTEHAIKVDDDYFHIPQQMPFYPTAGIIWPRVVELSCKTVNGILVCEGYNWAPKYGRAEYLFVTPRVKDPVVVAPACCQQKAPIVVYREVPQKTKKQ